MGTDLVSTSDASARRLRACVGSLYHPRLLVASLTSLQEAEGCSLLLGAQLFCVWSEGSMTVELWQHVF